MEVKKKAASRVFFSHRSNIHIYPKGGQGESLKVAEKTVPLEREGGKPTLLSEPAGLAAFVRVCQK